MSKYPSCCHTAIHTGRTCDEYDAELMACAINWFPAPYNVGAAPIDNPALDAELLAWARKKAASPWEWGPERGRCRCAFCGWEQMVRWDGGIEAHHNDGCLAVRANTVPK